MSVLQTPATAPNEAVSFLIQCSSRVLEGEIASQNIQTLQDDGATEDDVGARLGSLSMALASRELQASSAELILDAISVSSPEAQARSLDVFLGPEALLIITESDDLLAKLPSQTTSLLRVWRFKDGSFIFHSETPSDEFSAFCYACLHSPAFIDAWDQKHRQDRQGEPLSRAALIYARESLVNAKMTCFPISKEKISSFFSSQLNGDHAWLPGYSVQNAVSGSMLTPLCISKIIESPQGFDAVNS